VAARGNASPSSQKQQQAVMLNKAGAATYRRIARRYGAELKGKGGRLIALDSLTIAVETSATLAEGIAQLQSLGGRRFVAVTNKESIAEALRLTDGTPFGVMDSQGNIVKEAAAHTGGESDGASGKLDAMGT
jgi:hypothetical protein